MMRTMQAIHKTSTKHIATLPVLEKDYDLVVVGGGVGGCITAITAARKGLKTALVDNKPGLGGNACSDIGVSINGASFLGFFPNMREGGPVEELKELLAEADPFYRSTLTSGILLFWCEREQVAVYSDLTVNSVETEGRRVVAVAGTQAHTERNYRFTAAQFVDASGDGTVAALAGCAFMQGREARDTFHEILAPDKADQGVMGASLLLRASEKKIPTVYQRPAWAYEYRTLDDLPFRLSMEKGPVTSGFWWIEYAGDNNDPIGEYAQIREELLKSLYGAWSFYKNDPERKMEYHSLDSVTIAPAKRESRRIVGDHIITEHDISERTVFPDVVAYAGWNMDIHVPGGFKSKFKPNIHAFIPWVFGIPLRSLYAKDMDNLWLVGRDMSVSHVALGATRLQATIGTTGHAVGIAAALAAREKATSRETTQNRFREVQQEILKDGSFIPGICNEDPADKARQATVSATSEAPLAFTRSEDWLPVDKGRALSFPVTEGCVERVVLALQNNGSEPTAATLFFASCEHPNHFSHRTPLAESRVTLAPGETEVSFDVQALNLLPGLYAVLVMTDGDLSWRRSASEPYGTYTALYNPERFFTPTHDTKENLYALQRTIMVTRNAQPVEWVRVQHYRHAHDLNDMDRSCVPVPFAEISPAQHPYAPQQVTSGTSHTDLLPDLWISDPSQPLPQELTLSWEKPRAISEVRIVFDTDLDMWHPAALPIDYLVKSYTLALLVNGAWKTVVDCNDNRNRFVIHQFPKCDAEAVKLAVTAVHAAGKSARVFEMRCY